MCRYHQGRFLNAILKPLSSLGINPSIQTTALWSMLESFSNPFFTLLLIPILTHNIGLEHYGIYVMLMALVSLMSFTGLGMNTSITYYLATNQSSANQKSVAQRLGTAIVLTVFGTVGAAIVVKLALYLCQEKIYFYLPTFKQHNTLINMALLLMILSQVDLVISAAIKGMQQFKESSKLEFLIRLFGFIALAITAIFLKSIYAVIICAIFIAGLGIICRFFCLKTLASLRLCEIKINYEFAKELFYFGKWMTLQNIAVALFSSLDKVIIGVILGNKTVGMYNILISVAQLVHFIPANILTFVMPKVANNNRLVSMAMLIKMTLITFAIASLISSLLMMMKSYIFSSLSIDESYSNLYGWLILSYILLSLNIPSYFIALGMQLIRTVAIQCALGAVLGLLLLIYTLVNYGVMAAVASKMSYAAVALLLFLPVLKIIKNRA